MSDVDSTKSESDKEPELQKHVVFLTPILYERIDFDSKYLKFCHIKTQRPEKCIEAGWAAFLPFCSSISNPLLSLLSLPLSHLLIPYPSLPLLRRSGDVTAESVLIRRCSTLVSFRDSCKHGHNARVLGLQPPHLRWKQGRGRGRAGMGREMGRGPHFLIQDYAPGCEQWNGMKRKLLKTRMQSNGSTVLLSLSASSRQRYMYTNCSVTSNEDTDGVSLFEITLHHWWWCG